MKEITCRHCGYDFDETLPKCPYCETPAPQHEAPDAAARQKKFIVLFVAVVIICAIMVFLLPRDI